MSDLRKIEKMLTAILKSQDHIHWVGGYVYGKTASRGDDMIILYPVNEKFDRKICRVYGRNFKKLPGFINTAVIPADTTSEKDPKKSEAIKRGIYHECPIFQIVTYDGEETPVGPTRRFGDVLYISKQPPSQPSAPSTNGRQPVPQADSDHWTKEALTAANPLMFDTAAVKLYPFYKTAENVAKFRAALFGDVFQANMAAAYLKGLRVYSEERPELERVGKGAKEAHDLAKVEALNAFNRLAN